jgi:hypothetical protein
MPAGKGVKKVCRRSRTSSPSLADCRGTEQHAPVPAGICSVLSARDIWAFGGTNVAHWDGRTWTRTSVAGLLPPRQPLNFPGVRGILALSDRDVYAIGSGNAQDKGGPSVILRYDGHTWSKAAGGYYGIGTEPIQQVSRDGRGGLWLPMPGVDGRHRSLESHVR